MEKVYLACAMLAVAACGDGGKNDQESQHFPTEVDGNLPDTVDITMTCGDSQSWFDLGLFADGSAAVLVDGVITTGQYSVSDNRIRLQLDDGVSAESTRHLLFAGLLAGLNLEDSFGSLYPCITRTHTEGDRFSQDEAFRCGQLNIGGEEADTFNLYADGSSDWVNVYELPDGSDTTYRTRVGTYIYDAASGRLGMIYKGIDSDDTFVFEAEVSGSSVQVLDAPASGDGASSLSGGCAVL